MDSIKLYVFERLYDMLDEEVVAESEGLFDGLDESFMFEGLVNPAFSVGKSFGDFGQLDKDIKRGAVDKDKVMSTIQSLYDKNKKSLTDLKNRFAELLKKNSRKFKNHEIYAQIKPLNSLLDKVGNRGKSVMEINDLIRGAVIFDTKDDADKFVQDFIRKNGNKVVEVNEKEKGGDPMYGYYGAFHLLVDVEGVYAEIQVMTKTLWKQKKKAHDIYTAARSSSSGPSKQDRQLSKQIFNRGNKIESLDVCGDTLE
jgi:ppGpp synthetase/RelA/SpoT-type nucleotidyltranferase